MALEFQSSSMMFDISVFSDRTDRRLDSIPSSVLDFKHPNETSFLTKRITKLTLNLKPPKVVCFLQQKKGVKLGTNIQYLRRFRNRNPAIPTSKVTQSAIHHSKVHRKRINTQHRCWRSHRPHIRKHSLTHQRDARDRFLFRWPFVCIRLHETPRQTPSHILKEDHTRDARAISCGVPSTTSFKSKLGIFYFQFNIKEVFCFIVSSLSSSACRFRLSFAQTRSAPPRPLVSWYVPSLVR